MLLLISIGRVQRFVSEARKTVDLHNASQLYSDLARAIRDHLADHGAEVVFPAEGADAVPNRVVALVDDRVPDLAEGAIDAAKAKWHKTRERCGLTARADPPEITWVAAEGHSYAEQWSRAAQAADARKRTRTFAELHGTAKWICAVSGRYPALDVPGAGGEHLSAEAWLKRRAYAAAFPSTRSIALARYRRDVFRSAPLLMSQIYELQEAVERLPSAVRPRLPAAYPALARAAGPELALLATIEGSWFDPQEWADEEHAALADEATLTAGAHASERLRDAAARTADIMFPPPYLAMLMQDVDRMGERIGTGEVTREFHGRISQVLGATASRQRQVVESEDLLGRIVYAGGDDLLALAPAASALGIASAARELVDTELGAALPGITASTAIVFFHQSHPLQDAVEHARRALELAKEPTGRNNLAIRILKGGGIRDQLVTQWKPGGGADALAALAARRISGASLAARLELEGPQLTDPTVLRLELTRLLQRQSVLDAGAAVEAATTIVSLCRRDRSRRLVQQVTDVLHLVQNLEAFGCHP